MFGRSDGIRHAPAQPQRKVGQKKQSKLSRIPKVFGRNTKKVKATNTQRPERIVINGKDLSSRKIVWLEKVKHYLNIFFCNVLLKLHIYRDQEERVALKESIDVSKNELNELNNKEARQQNVAKMKEELEDGQYVEAARRAKDAGKAAFGEGKSRLWKWLRV
ncbi:hypothetical protein [Endozoicomonas atrinae]|uniref:hypothetical protein n=1 Tax=Endozoicomonas atrinae TaxID=1333660 RepID=UPI000826842D|nr:hypothetical protein [Endozoicomonas atrinae]